MHKFQDVITNTKTTTLFEKEKSLRESFNNILNYQQNATENPELNQDTYNFPQFQLDPQVKSAHFSHLAFYTINSLVLATLISMLIVKTLRYSLLCSINIQTGYISEYNSDLAKLPHEIKWSKRDC